jgi:hypothetical protein
MQGEAKEEPDGGPINQGCVSGIPSLNSGSIIEIRLEIAPEDHSRFPAGDLTGRGTLVPEGPSSRDDLVPCLQYGFTVSKLKASLLFKRLDLFFHRIPPCIFLRVRHLVDLPVGGIVLLVGFGMKSQGMPVEELTTDGVSKARLVLVHSLGSGGAWLVFPV